VKSLVGSLLNGLSNRAPVPLARVGRTNSPVPALFGAAGNDDVRLMETMGSVGTVFAIVSMLARSTASAQWHLYRKSKTGLKEDRIEVTSHAALDLINKPNKFMTLQEMIETAQQHVDLTGEADVVLSLAGKLPYEMWPIRPDKITCVPDPYDFIAGYVYRGPDGEAIPLSVNELMQIRMPNPIDPYNGLGPVQSILTDIDSAMYSTEWNKNFFLNSAEPGGVIQVDHRMEDDEYRQMRDRWGEQHKGVAQAHRVAIIEAGSQWVDRKITQRDMEFAELSTISRDKILEAFGFPKAMIGIVEDVNRANAETSEYVYTKWLIVPRLDRWRSMFNNDLLPMYAGGDGLEFDYDSPVPTNSEDEVQMLAAKWQAVAWAVPLGYDPEDILVALDLPKVKFEKPEPPPPPVIAPPSQDAKGIVPSKGAESNEKTKPVTKDDLAILLINLSEKWTPQLTAFTENAMKWEAVSHLDDNTCEPCRENDGQLYRNREDAYADYPDGKGFKNCVGAEYGNTCRCVVRKRKAGS
jgi:HK97 family phage portal protein